MRFFSRVPFTLLVPAIALVALALARSSLDQPPEEESAALAWLPLHRHGGEARGADGLGLSFGEVRRSGQRIYAMGYPQSLRSEDGGVTWTELPGGKGKACNSAALRADGLVLIGCRAGMFRSVDGAGKWMEIDIPEDGLISALSLDGSDVAAAGRSIILSKDAGVTWARVKAPAVNYGDIARRDRTIIVVSGAGLVMRSADGGVTWTQHWLPMPAMPVGVAFAGENIVAIAAIDGTVFRSTDDGVRWVAIRSPARARLRGIAFTRSGEGLAVGHWGEAIHSTDAGLTWRRERSGTHLHLSHVEADSSGAFLVVGMRETVLSVSTAARR